MTKKTIVIALVAIVLAAVAFSFYRARILPKANKGEVLTFLAKFNWDLKLGNTDTLLRYFELKKDKKKIVKLLGLLSGKTDLSGKANDIVQVGLIPDNGEVVVINPGLVKATVPVLLSAEGAKDKLTSVVIRMRKISRGQFKIIQIDARDFAKDYIAFENNLPLKDRGDYGPDMVVNYDPMTLAAFKTAETLKDRYDTVVWFAHVDRRPYFYVVKGKWDMDANLGLARGRESKSLEPYKMGLVGPDLKEIIPVDYDLVYNIGGTFAGMVEVERDKKRGFYDLNGKIVVPVIYDQIFPIDDDETLIAADVNLAVLRKGNNYYYLKRNLTISPKQDIKVNDFFSKIRNLHKSFSIDSTSLGAITEYNSHDEQGMVFIAPSYLADLNMIAKVQNIKNPLRQVSDDGYLNVTTSYDIAVADKQSHENDSWLSTMFYSIADNFLGGRGGLYASKTVVLIDKKADRILSSSIETDYTGEEGGGSIEGACDVNSIKAINDTLFEVKSGAAFSIPLYDSTKVITGGPYYHYLAIKNNKLVELPQVRFFGFTKYVKMDESYLRGCYVIQSGGVEDEHSQTIDYITPEMLRYIKNEIFANYRYQFKDKRWQRVFEYSPLSVGDYNKPYNANVDDSLTVIDKYNINWIVNRLKQSGQSKVLAAK